MYAFGLFECVLIIIWSEMVPQKFIRKLEAAVLQFLNQSKTMKQGTLYFCNILFDFITMHQILNVMTRLNLE